MEQRLAVAESEIIKTLAYDPCVIVGRGAAAALKEEHVLKVFIHADRNRRAARAVNQYGVAPKQAESFLSRCDKRRADYFKFTTATNWKDADIYHLCLNSGKLGIAQCVEVLYQICVHGEGSIRSSL